MKKDGTRRRPILFHYGHSGPSSAPLPPPPQSPIPHRSPNRSLLFPLLRRRPSQNKKTEAAEPQGTAVFKTGKE